MDMEAKAQALREAVEGGASNSDLMQMLAEIQAAERERCDTLARAALDAATDGKWSRAAVLLQRLSDGPNLSYTTGLSHNTGNQ